MKSRIDVLPKLYLPLLLILCAAYAWRPLDGGDDFWAHAAIGRWIWQHGQAPHETLFLWGAAPIPWIAHSWLTQLTFFGLMAAGGPKYGPYIVMAFTALMAMLPIVMLWHLWVRRAPVSVLTPCLFALAIWCSAARFRPRPELFTAFFLACLLILLVRWGDKHGKSSINERPRWLLNAVLLILLFILWANFHGAVAVGIVLLCATILCDLVQERGSRRAWLLALTGVLCVAAIAMNPYGLAYWQALQPVSGRMFPHIDEWKPFWKPTELYALAAGEAALALIAVVLWGLNARRRWAHLAWLLVMAVFFVTARRHLWLLALVALAVAVANGQFLRSGPLWKAWRRLMQRGQAQSDQAQISTPVPAGMRLIARGGVIILLVAGIVAVTPSNLLPLRATSRYLPQEMASFIQRRKHVQRLFNDYENSSYLQWRFAGQPPLFIDLLNAYPDALLVDDYFDIIKANARGRRLLDARRIDCVTLRRHEPDETMAKLANFLNRNPAWKRVYKGADGTVWERVGQGTAGR